MDGNLCPFTIGVATSTSELVTLVVDLVDIYFKLETFMPRLECKYCLGKGFTARIFRCLFLPARQPLLVLVAHMFKSLSLHHRLLSILLVYKTDDARRAISVRDDIEYFN